MPGRAGNAIRPRYWRPGAPAAASQSGGPAHLVPGPGRSIGIDDGLAGHDPSAVTDARARAERFADLFRAVYLTFHRRDGPRSQLPGASRAVLEHLALAGPL